MTGRQSDFSSIVKSLEDVRENRGAYKMKRPPVHLWSPPFCGDIGLKICRDGSWTYQNSPFTRMALVRLFASVLRRDEDEQIYLVTPGEKILIEVEDAPFAGVQIDVENKGAGRGQNIHLTTNFDEQVLIGKSHMLWFETEPKTGGVKPYCHVHKGLNALLRQQVALELMHLGETKQLHDGPWFGLWSGGVFFKMAPIEEDGTERLETSL